MRTLRRPLPIALGLLIASCIGDAAPEADGPAPEASASLPAGAEGTSLFGVPLVPASLPEETRTDFEANLATARADLEAHPDSALAWIWVGRREAYLGDYRDAIAQFTRGLERFPEDARFLRHRGHRYISVRQFEEAVTDLSRAAAMISGTPDQVEPDGLPNARGIPTSTLHFNIHYHLGLAHYLLGDLDAAWAAFQDCLAVSDNPDAQVATRHWLYMIARRSERDDAAAEILAPVTEDMDVIENQSYHNLLLMYKGLRAPEDLIDLEATDPSGSAQWYGVANWFLYNGDQDRATQLMRRMVAAPGQWAAFGTIAAEADLWRMGLTP